MQEKHSSNLASLISLQDIYGIIEVPALNYSILQFSLRTCNQKNIRNISTGNSREEFLNIFNFYGMLTRLGAE
jgi:hypothetical protein